MSARGFATFSFMRWNISVGILLGPKALLLLSLFMLLIISISLVGLIKKVTGLGSVRNFEKSFP